MLFCFLANIPTVQGVTTKVYSNVLCGNVVSDMVSHMITLLCLQLNVKYVNDIFTEKCLCLI